MATVDPRDGLVRFLVLGRSKDGTVTISVHAARADTRLWFVVGRHQHPRTVAGQVAVAGVLDAAGTGLSRRYAREFDAAELHWLVPFLVRLAAGKNVTEKDLIAAYRAQHGNDPAVEHLAR